MKVIWFIYKKLILNLKICEITITTLMLINYYYYINT